MTQVIISAPPAILFLDTPEAIKVAEYFTQRSKNTLTKKYPKRGLKIHTIPGESKNPMNKQCGNRDYIVYSEYLAFIRTISEDEKESQES